jgi:outer membrane protein TolC
VTTPQSYKELAGLRAQEKWKEAEPKDGAIRGDWWQIFGDPELNRLEEQLNKNNQNIALSFQNYMAARALVRAVRATLFPTVSIGTSGSHNYAARAAPCEQQAPLVKTAMSCRWTYPGSRICSDGFGTRFVSIQMRRKSVQPIWRT